MSLISSNLPLPMNIDSKNNNDLNNSKIINEFRKELEIIANTGETHYSWNELKPYIIYFYKKNINSFPSNNIISINLKFLDSGELVHQNKNIAMNNENEESNKKDIISSDDEEENKNTNKNFTESKTNNDLFVNRDNTDCDIIEYINKLHLMPFTIQRIAELLIEPTKYYASSRTYNKAFAKLVNIDFD